MLSEIVTVTDEVYVPAAGLNAGVATCWTTVYVALATALLAIPPAAAIAFIVVVCATWIGLV